MKISSFAYRRLGNTFLSSARGGGKIHHPRRQASLLLGAGRNESSNLTMNLDIPINACRQRFQSSLSSFAEPGTLFDTSTALSVTSGSVDRDAQLRADVRTMGRLLGQIIQKHHGIEIFDTIEKLRHLAKQWRDSGAGRDTALKQQADDIFRQLSDTCEALSTEELLLVSRAFTHFLAIVNAAESHHRARLLQSSTKIKEDSCAGVLEELLTNGVNGKQISPDTIMECLSTQTVELVLTAHPTQINRRTILEKQRRVQEVLTRADTLRSNAKGGTLSHYIEKELDNSLEREIVSLWQSDEVSRVKPTPENEAERGTLVVETVLWDALPSFLRKLNFTLKEKIGRALPLESAPIIYSSWMGGDRDGNPNVLPTTTRTVCYTKRSKAAELFARDLQNLHKELSITNSSDDFKAALMDKLDVKEDELPREPYRAFLKPMIAKMKRTKKWAEDQLAKSATSTQDATESGDIYLHKEEFLNDLLVIHKSLTETGNEITADGFLTDVIRNVAAFGLTLVPLDIRQESGRHEEAVDAITRFLGLGSYSQWTEETKLTWLQQQLTSNRPLLRPGIWNDHPDFFSDTTIDTLETFAMISKLHQAGCDESLGAYVISQATTASDVLNVLLLQQDAGVKAPLRVVPLFETLDDLNGAEDTMKTLFSLPVYMGKINGKQEVMIGYSDSAKDAGRLAASWAQYETQEALANLARGFGVDLTFFHGKGGTVGRGGNPQTFKAILAHAPNTINGQFRVTEQGEMINQNFGHVDRAERTMDIYTAAVLAEKLSDRPGPSDEFRGMMQKLSDISCQAYRKVVRGDDRFVPYFRSATPELELANLNIGSRPAKRKASGGVESLRAIPWIFAWTQTRLNLPTWLGVGEAISEVLKSDDADLLRQLYSDCKSFRTTVDLVEMVLAKSEPAIAAHYDAKLVHDEKAKEIGAEVRMLHSSTEQAVLELTGHTTLSEDNVMLRRLLHVRNPYVDCLNVLQAETLKRIREYDEGTEPKELKDALMTTITGVANGMGNTG